MNRRGFLGFLAAIPALPLLSKLKGGKVPADSEKVGDAAARRIRHDPFLPAGEVRGYPSLGNWFPQRRREIDRLYYNGTQWLSSDAAQRTERIMDEIISAHRKAMDDFHRA